MALKSTVFKAQLAIADVDRSLYADHALTLARHPSETDERMMMRLLAFALHVPADDARGALEMARGLCDTDEPDLWRHDLDGTLLHWIEVGLPDERRQLKACGRAARVGVLAYGTSVPLWWAALADRVARCANLDVWQVDAAASRALATLARRTMRLQVTVNDGQVWVGDGESTVEFAPRRLLAARLGASR